MRTRKIKKGCQIETIRSKNRILMKCKNLKRSPTAQEIINQIKNKKIIIR